MKKNNPIPDLFCHSGKSLIYYHSHTATPKELKMAAMICPVFEIDLAWGHSSFHPSIAKGAPYIGHPEEFYTKMGNPFPADNVTLVEFQNFLKDYPSVKVLIDVKDEATFPFLKGFIKAVGAERCIVHAFIKNWTIAPELLWYHEEIDLFAIDKILSQLGVPLIANCHGFSDEHMEENGLIFKMIQDARRCKSVVSLGLYYPEAPLPNFKFLQLINKAGYYAWVNGNVDQFQEKIGEIQYIAMSDDMQKCGFKG